MLDALPDQYYTWVMDNIFVSEKLLWAAYSDTKSKTIVHIFFQQRFYLIHNFVVKEDYTKDRKNLISWGGDKVCCVWGGVKCPDIVELILYDTKPVNFLFMASYKPVWDIN